MPSDCRFILDHPNGVYYSGQTINGIINLTTTKDKSIRHARILFVGEGKVKWSETTSSSGSTDTNDTVHYKSHEVYIRNETYVCGGGTFPLGLHTYTFSIALPRLCPTSCEGKFGHIRYVLSLILERTFRFNNVYSIPLTILHTVDLNLNPSFKLPLLAERADSLCHWNCSWGKIIYGLRIKFGAYAPGQWANYWVCIRNLSMTDTAGYTLELIQKMTFTARSPTRKERHKKKILLQQGSSETCLRLTNRIFEGSFRIPPVQPTTERDSIISVTYKLQAALIMDGCRSPKILSLPLVIGNIPLRESLSSECNGFSNSAPIAPPFGIDRSTIYSGPPSYQAAVQCDDDFVDDDIDKHHRVVGFHPLYPMYS